MHCLSYKELIFMQTLNAGEKEKCRTCAGLFGVLSDKFKLQHNKNILPLQYCKLTRKQKENAKEWMGHLRLKANEYGYKERDKTKGSKSNSELE